MTEEEINQPKISQFNSAISELYRLDYLLQLANLHSRNGELMRWNWVLDAYWRELSATASDKDTELLKKINNKVAKYKKSKLLYQVLQNKEIFLRRLQNAQGKGSKFINPDEDMMDE